MSSVSLPLPTRIPSAGPDPVLGATVSVDTLGSVLHLEFAQACDRLFEARARRARKDTPGHRAEVGAALASVDAVLDMFLDAYGEHGRSGAEAA